MTSTLLATMVALLLSSVTVESRQVALPGPQCHPSVINSMPQRIRQICKALETIWEFNDTMEDYLDEKVLLEILDQYLLGGIDASKEDLDHVFLRFGK